MDWKIKVIAFWVFQFMPGGKSLYALAQRRITKSLTDNRRSIFERAENHLGHVARFREGGALQGGCLFEFGAGHDLLGNLIMYRAGVDHQLVYDIEPNMNIDLINNMLADLAGLDHPDLVRPAQKMLSCVEDLNAFYGIEYRAPADARKTGLPESSIDLIVSTNTLEHIPSQAIADILKECARIAKPSAIVSFVIDYGDHYSYSDSSITPYNFLKFSPFVWSLCNPDAHSQNRMRHSQFCRLFSESPFSIVRESAELVAGGVEDVGKLRISKSFRGMDAADLAARTGRFVLRRAQPV